MLFSPIPRNLSIARWEAWSNQCFLHALVVATWCHWGSILHQILDPSHPESSQQSPLPRRGKYGKKKVRALRVSDDSDDRCFFSSFCSSDGSCLIVKKITYTSVDWDKNLQLLMFWAAESGWISYFLFNWIAHDSYIRKLSVGGFPSTFARRRLRGVTAVVLWKVHLTYNDARILDSHWRRGE